MVGSRSRRQEVLDEFGNHLSRERGLQPGTVGYYRAVAESFLSRAADASVDLDGTGWELTTGDVTGFMLARARTGRSLAHQASAVRALLRFLHLQGYTLWPLVGAVPAAARWRHMLPPRALPPEQVTRLLAGCDQRTAVGRRDRAVLILMARLGLRAGEVAALRLDDIDWRAGEVLVRGKADRWERLPLPVDVGAALADHLQQRLSGDSQRHVFLRVRAPRAPLTTRGVCSVMRNACVRAGLAPVGFCEATGIPLRPGAVTAAFERHVDDCGLPTIRLHDARHGACSLLLAGGVPIEVVQMILGHSSPAVTRQVYAHVMRRATAELVDTATELLTRHRG